MGEDLGGGADDERDLDETGGNIEDGDDDNEWAILPEQ